jgi:dolichol-phosphate mannosyltransferase
MVLPAYNEENSLPELLKRIDQAMNVFTLSYRSLVVNDGSQDRTLEKVRQLTGVYPIEILDHGVNKGLGQAILTGLRRASELAAEDDLIISMDADNTHDPMLVGEMVRKIQSGNDLVIASRYEKGGREVGLSWLRHILSGGASTLLRLFFPIPGARDYTCGYRAYTGRILQTAFRVYGNDLVEERGFTCMAEILLKMRSLNARVSEVPLVLRYDLKTGPSKMKIIRTILRYAVLMTRIRLRRA